MVPHPVEAWIIDGSARRRWQRRAVLSDDPHVDAANGDMMTSTGTQTRLNDKTFAIVRWLQDPVNSVLMFRQDFGQSSSTTYWPPKTGKRGGVCRALRALHTPPNPLTWSQ
jgi:hypothetical protein